MKLCIKTFATFSISNIKFLNVICLGVPKVISQFRIIPTSGSTLTARLQDLGVDPAPGCHHAAMQCRHKYRYVCLGMQKPHAIVGHTWVSSGQFRVHSGPPLLPGQSSSRNRTNLMSGKCRLIRTSHTWVHITRNRQEYHTKNHLE